MSFLRTRKNEINRNFFQKFQNQVSKAPGFKPILSYEDFLKLVQATEKINEVTSNTSAPPVEIQGLNKDVDITKLRNSWVEPN